jgi:3-hydroxy-9,10-secoandrosta-1,3,5(10)-triene-9,17-dione monooxygenase
MASRMRQEALASIPSGLVYHVWHREDSLLTGTKAAAARQPDPRPIAAPEPDMTAEVMIARAVTLRSDLRDGQATLEAAGRVSDEMNRRFIEAGFYRAVQPRLFGGYEFDVPDFMRVMAELGRGCAESGWVVALTAGHAHLLAGFPIDGQADIYGTEGTFLAPGVPGPFGIATPVPGGYRVNGAWDYVSGCDVATHFIGGCRIAGAEGGGSILICIDRKDYTIAENWQVIGMQGTGSKRVKLEDVYVPTPRTMPFTDGDGAIIYDRPGWAVLDNPMYRGRTTPFLVAESTSVVVGAAYGALDLYEEILKTRKSRLPPFSATAELAEYQHNFGRCQALVDTAHAAMIRAGEMYMEMSRDGTFDAEWERRLHMIEQQAIHLAYEAVDIMFRTAGTSSARKDAMLGRYWRNLGVIRGHLAHQSDTVAINFARGHFGLPTIGRI